MKIEPFGRALIETLDLDPVYVMLYRAELPADLLKRWLVAYWCFYNSGAASRIAEEGGWAAYGDRWPRGTERRHFRGDLAVTSLAALRTRYERPEDFYDYVAAGHNLADVIARVEEHRGFGPWISFKVVDMLERVARVPLDFDAASVFMFAEPRKAVDMLWEERVAPIIKTKLNADERRDRVVASLLETYSDLRAPPAGDRAINIQEAETVLCKWKSHVHGHYPVGKDIREIRESLHDVGNLAGRLERCLPENVG